MKKNQIFRSILLSAVAATAFSAQVSAQSYDNYNKRELLLQVLDQSRPNDYVPVFFNVHFPDKFGYKAVKSHIDWFRTTHVDFVNVKYEFDQAWTLYLLNSCHSQVTQTLPSYILQSLYQQSYLHKLIVPLQKEGHDIYYTLYLI